MSPSEFSVYVRDLDAGGKSFRFAVPRAWVREALADSGVSAGPSDGSLDLRLSRSGRDVIIRGTLTAGLVVPCARCLEPALVQIQEDLSALAVVGPSDAGGHADTGPDNEDADADCIPYDGETLVLDELVRDELLLAIPMIPLCSETCAGIRHGPGDVAGPEQDPRLSPLAKLKLYKA
jgi:uncharacterized protein